MISEKMIEEFEKQKKENPGFVVLIRRGIFHYLLQEQAERLAASLNLKVEDDYRKLPFG